MYALNANNASAAQIRETALSQPVVYAKTVRVAANKSGYPSLFSEIGGYRRHSCTLDTSKFMRMSRVI